MNNEGGTARLLLKHDEGRILGHEKRWKANIVNYADDLVICCRAGAVEALAAIRTMMSRLKLTVNENNTETEAGSATCVTT